MQMFDFLKWNRRDQLQPIDFVPTIQISPTSTLFIQCTPNDPNTSSNIVVNTYISKTNRTLLQTRIRWSRFKFITQSDHSVEELPAITGNAYRCQPADLGSYIRAKITSFDVSCSGEGQVTIGPIRLDPTVKPLIQGALYSKQLRSQIKVLEKNIPKQVDMVLSQSHIRLNEISSAQQLKMAYDIAEPRIQLNPKDPTKIFIRFQNDNKNTVRQWLNLIYGESPNKMINDTESMRSYNSGSSKSKLFKGLQCANKIEVVFLTRHCRDQFLFSLKAFISKQTLKNTIVMQNIQHIQEMKTPTDVHKFFQFMSLKYEIFRLSELAKQFQNDRDKKVQDISDLEQSIGQMTLTYTKIIEQKGKLSHIDFNQSYSEISLRRQEILGRKQMRQLMNENQQLKQRVRQLNQELELAKFFKKQNNDSMLFNQTNNPFLKKNNMGDSIYNPIMAQEVDDELNGSRFHKGNMKQLAKSYMDLMKENQRLKNQKKSFHAGNISRDMVDLLQSLHDEDDDPQTIVKKQKIQLQQLQDEITKIKNKNIELMQELKKAKQPRLNQSVAHQQLNQSAYTNRSQLQSQRQGGSFYSINSSQLNQSMTSEAGIMMLQQKLIQIQQTNKKILGQNQRLRRQRNHFRGLYEQSQKKKQQSSNMNQHNLCVSQAQREVDSSMMFDRQNFQKIREQKQCLQNENKNLKKKLDSVVMENKKLGGESMLQKKCQSLTKQNNYLRQQNQSLKMQLQELKQRSSKNNSIDSSAQNQNQTIKLKKINLSLLEQIKNLKIQLEKKQDPLYNSRVIQLQNQVNFYKNQGSQPKEFETSTKQLIQQVSRLQKAVQKLKSQSKDKDSKLSSQQNLIQRLMNQHQQEKASISGKDKSYSQTRNDSNQATQKLKKKVRQLQEQIILMRRSADALNRSKDISMQMQQYNEQRIEMMQKQRQALLQQNQRLSRMCQKYAKDARQGIKWKKQYLDIAKTLKKDEQIIQG